MKKVIKEEQFEVTLTNPQIYKRLTFEDNTFYWVNSMGVKMNNDWEGVGIELERLYKERFAS